MTDAQRAADAHAARVVLAALDTAHGQAALCTNPEGVNQEFLEWYAARREWREANQRLDHDFMTAEEWHLRKFLERLGTP